MQSNSQSNNVIPFDEVKRRKNVWPHYDSRPVLPGKPALYCVGCTSDHFHIFDNGDVFCSNCHSLIRNIHASFKSTPAR